VKNENEKEKVGIRGIRGSQQKEKTEPFERYKKKILYQTNLLEYH
jgi:hypothetical protein